MPRAVFALNGTLNGVIYYPHVGRIYSSTCKASYSRDLWTSKMQTHVLSIYKTILHRVNAVNGRHEKMNSVKLHIALHNAVEKFGSNILCEDRLINILLDYGAFNDNPAIKNILKTMIVDGYCQKVLDLARRKRFSLSSLLNQSNKLEKPQGEEWKTKVQSYCVDFTKKNGYLHDLVVYATESILYALGWKTNESNIVNVPKKVKGIKSSSSQSSSQGVVVNNSNNTQKISGTNTNLTNSETYQSITNTQYLIINVKPINAEIFVDGKQQYVSNGISAVELPIGQHNYEIKATDYITRKGCVLVKRNQRCEISAELRSVFQTYRITITLANEDALIYVDNKYVGKGCQTIELKRGIHTILCRENGYLDYSKTIIVEDRNIIVAIPRMFKTYATLKINVYPYGTDIYIDGKMKGKTPMVVDRLSAGVHKIAFRTPTGKEYIKELECKGQHIFNIEDIIE